MQIAMSLHAKTTTLLMLFLWAAMTLPVRAEDDSVYWALSRDGEAVGHLLGTIHSEDPRVLDFNHAFVAQLTSSEVFAMEMVPNIPTMTRLMEYMHYQDGTTLESRIGADRFTRLQKALAGYKVPADWVARMKVWAAMMTLSVPPPQSGFFMDFSLSLRAAGAGMQVVGLETLEQQLSFLENMPMDQQIELLDHALEDFDKVADVHRQMIESYLSGDLSVLQKEAEMQMSQLDPASKQYFMEQGIDQRNLRMLETLRPYLQQGTVFIAVGALHLPGEQGLVSLLREEGLELTPLPLPFLLPEHGGQAHQDGQHQEGNAPGRFQEER